MKPKEILNEINGDYENSPIKALKTLSNVIEELRTYYIDSRNSAQCWHIVDLWDNLLQCKIHLGMFVPCVDGKPLDEPIHIGLGIAEEAEKQAREVYSKALQDVIFEGWEVSIDTDSSRTVITNGVWYILINEQYTYITTKTNYETHVFGAVIKITTLADLAAATIDNPVKLK